MKRFSFYGVICLLLLCPALEARKKVKKDEPFKAQEKELAKGFAPASYAIDFTGEYGYDAQVKRDKVVRLVERGLSYLKEHSFIDFLRLINHTLDFNEGNLYLFIYNDKGVCIAHGRDTRILWKNQLNEQDAFGNFFVKNFVTLGEQGGGWFSYHWNSSTKVVYIQPFTKDNKKYVLGCAYYPETKEDETVSLVRGAVAYFNKVVDEQGRSPEEAFGDFSFPSGKFIAGEIYIYVFDKNGIILANPFDPSEIGVNYWEEKDSNGYYYVRDMVKKLSEKAVGEGYWFDFEYYNAPERGYVERVEDKKGNSYFIASGYNPYADKSRAVDIVKRGVKAIQERGLNTVISLVNDISNQEFVYGSIALFIYDTEGNVLANGERPALAGKNIKDEQDQAGVLYVQEIINDARTQKSALVNYLLSNTIVSAYVEEVVLDGKVYVVGAKFFPVSKESSVIQLVKSAKSFLSKNIETVAFREFSKYSGTFIIGDVTVFVYDTDGTCYADGLEVEYIWRNRLNELDQDGKYYVKTMVDMGKKAPLKVKIKKNNATMVAYTEPLKKGKKTYIVGSGFYQ